MAMEQDLKRTVAMDLDMGLKPLDQLGNEFELKLGWMIATL
jgi:hypothetical protein|uniref:Uncharacterized protein n=1 Tax=Picea sitchensis TaxID=3332 RepID=A0A6B9XR40_PICSI|nr:hypothetical protein Q903MT_gene5635 [Picea sitchensis]